MGGNSRKALTWLMSLSLAVSMVPVSPALADEGAGQTVDGTQIETTDPSAQAGGAATDGAAAAADVADTAEGNGTAVGGVTDQTGDSATDGAAQTDQTTTGGPVEDTTDDAATDSATADDPAAGPSATAVISTIDAQTTLADGIYAPDAFAHRIASEGSADLSVACSQITVRDGRAYATVTFGDATLERACAGTESIAVKTRGDGSSTFELPVDLDLDIAVTVYGADDVVVGAYILTVTLSEPAAEGSATAAVPEDAEGANAAADVAAAGNAAKDAEQEARTPVQTLAAQALDLDAITAQATVPNIVVSEGDYTTSAASDGKMIKVTSCEVTSAAGKMTAKLKFSSDSIVNLYLGTEDEAKAVDPATTYAPDAQGYFTIPVASLDTPLAVAIRSKSRKDGSLSWKAHTITVSSADLVKSDASAYTLDKVAGEGTYGADATSDSKMIKITSCEVTSTAGKMTATLKFSSDSIVGLYLGTEAEAKAAAAEDIYTPDAQGCFTIPLSSLGDLTVAIHSKSRKDGSLSWKGHTITIAAADLYRQVGVSYRFVSDTSGMTLPAGVTDQLAQSAAKTQETADIVNEYATAAYDDVEVIDPATKGLEGTWKFTPGWDSTSIANTEADVAFTGHWTYVEAGSYGVTYRFVSATAGKSDLPSGVASQLGAAKVTSAYGNATVANEFAGRTYSDVAVSDGTWSFVGWDTNQVVGVTGDVAFTGSWVFTASSTDSGNTGGNGNGKEDAKNSDNSPVSSSAGNSTTLADGTYTPDSFSWGGGSGRLSGISCLGIRVSGGQAWATIVFQSSSYSAVSANGGVYYNTTPGTSVSTFEIPVALNQNNTISGLTTAMSAPHWVTYTVFIYLAAAGDANASDAALTASTTLDATAPAIAGLTYRSETELEYAKYFKIYNYDQGISLIEIDLSKGTATENANAATNTTATDTTAQTSSTASNASAQSTSGDSAAADEGSAATTDEESTATATSESAITGLLYKGNVVKYLVVPQGVEIPAGLDKQVIVIQQPKSKTFVASADALATLDKLGLDADVATVGLSESDISVDAVRKALSSGTVKSAGTYDAPDYKTLVSDKCDLAVSDSTLLSHVGKDAASSSSDADADDATLSTDEQVQRFSEMGANFATLGIPLLVDRSGDETGALAQAEWIKVYGAIFGCSDQANAIFEAAKTA